MGKETIVGRVVVARSPLTPKGFVFMDGANWTAGLRTATSRRVTGWW
jgi:hypothetical protein